ncbi:hook protein [Providencia rettgeri]|uniref:hook protein n=1 Tax=Providencia rettgeri TaxID=587 RepID=UPI002882666B|nr:hook protein [Providencia rettgeri]MDK3108337.1 hook protein [Providencia rettgeri]WRR95990.1 hook protein [Providencia rettgeri]
MTIEQLQEENAKLKQAIIDIFTNCGECESDNEENYYIVEQSIVNDAFDLTED